MAVNINKLDAGKPSFFMGNGAMLMFDPIPDYSSVGVEALVNPIDLCNIKEDSTSWEGDDITIDTKKNEQGKAVVTIAKEGTFAFSFDVMSTDEATLKKLMKAINITGTAGAWMKGAKIVGVGRSLASQICPVGWCNQDMDNVLVFPKARVTCTYKYDDGLEMIHVVVTAEKVDTDKLQTVMHMSGAKVDYGTAM